MKLPPGYVPGSGVHKATAFGGFGERLMQEMGWEKGQGLGKDKKGMKKAIEVKLKDDTIGVGAKPTFAWEKKWWEEAFDSKAQQMQAPSSDSSDGSDDDVILNVNCDGTLSSAKAEELKIAAALAKDPWGRFGGRKGKMARIARQEAERLAALQARTQSQQSASTSHPASSSVSAAAAAAEGARASGHLQKAGSKAGHELSKAKGKKRRLKAEVLEVTDIAGQRGEEQKLTATAQETYRELADKHGCDSGQAHPQTAEQTTGKSKKKKKKSSTRVDAAVSETATAVTGLDTLPREAEGREAERHKARQVHVVPATPANQGAPFQATPRTGWWGAGRFVSAGCLEGMEHTLQHVAKERQTFDESTQEGLYMAAHEGKTANKKGLGSASAPRKVAGTRWQGTRTLIDDEQEATEAAAASEPGSNADASLPLQNAKWKKLARATLLEAETRSMQVKALKQEVLRRALAKEGLAVDKTTRKALKGVLFAKIQGSSALTIEQGVVRLA